jgi:hypothetical protein
MARTGCLLPEELKHNAKEAGFEHLLQLLKLILLLRIALFHTANVTETRLTERHNLLYLNY